MTLKLRRPGGGPGDLVNDVVHGVINPTFRFILGRKAGTFSQIELTFSSVCRNQEILNSLFLTILEIMKIFAVLSILSASGTVAFTPAASSVRLAVGGLQSTLEEQEVAPVDKRTGKPTGTSFLPEETIERARNGNPTEKAKIAKDATSAWVDVYEYARKIREGEMTWEDVEKADLDTVRTI